MAETYDLTYFKFLGGIVADDSKKEIHTSDSEDDWSTESTPDGTPQYDLAPPRSKELDDVPANEVIFNSLWSSKHKTNRSSMKVAAGKVSDIKGKFERRLSGVFSAFSGDKTEKTKETPKPKHHEIPSSSANPVKSTAVKRDSTFGFQGLPKHPESAEAQRKPKAGPPPPMKMMTLAKGWNSGQAPTHCTKGTPTDY